MPMKSNFTREYEAFLEELIAARKRNGLTQQAVADLLHKPQSFVSKYENGQRRLDVVEFCQIARVLRENPVCILQQVGLI
ncbi:MAG: helix-turn-helix transcriptional regulator [Desulfovibrio sp.]|nr:helix-turn-helix transcriptional regulator [Desulfovibrio sp.]